MIWTNVFREGLFFEGMLLVLGPMLCALWAMVHTLRATKLNWAEYITMRIGFSIYAGWQTAATIVGITQWLKVDVIKNSESEVAWACVMIWVA